MGDTISPLSASVLRNLADKLYEKRKIAALEVELLFNKTPTLSLSPPLCLPLSNCFFSFSFASKNVGIREEVHANGDLWLELGPQLTLAASVERSLYDNQNVGHGNRILLHLPIWLLGQLRKEGLLFQCHHVFQHPCMHACMWFLHPHHTWLVCSLYLEQNQEKKKPQNKNHLHHVVLSWFELWVSDSALNNLAATATTMTMSKSPTQHVQVIIPHNRGGLYFWSCKRFCVGKKGFQYFNRHAPGGVTRTWLPLSTEELRDVGFSGGWGIPCRLRVWSSHTQQHRTMRRFPASFRFSSTILQCPLRLTTAR
jgi:hypothetical protein